MSMTESISNKIGMPNMPMAHTKVHTKSQTYMTIARYNTAKAPPQMSSTFAMSSHAWTKTNPTSHYYLISKSIMGGVHYVYYTRLMTAYEMIPQSITGSNTITKQS